MDRLEALYGTAPTTQMQPVAGRTLVNSRGGTTWQQQYMPQASPTASNARIQPQAQVPPAVAAAAQQMGYQTPLNGQRPIGSSNPNTQQANPSAPPVAIDANVQRPQVQTMGGGDPANDRIGAEGAAASSYRPLYNPREANPNRGQVSPRAQVMFEEMRKRAAMSPAQGMAHDRGVFSGGQQAAQMPGLPNGGRLAALYG